MGNENFPKWLVVVICLILVVNIGAMFYKGQAQKVDLSGIETKLTEIGTKTDANAAAIGNIKISETPATNQSPDASLTTTPGIYTLTKGEYEDQAIEDEAFKLATESVNSRDFRKAALEALEDFGITEVESYKDITVKIVEADVDEDEVTFDVKITYLIDGDEEETDRARLKEFTVKVDDLDYDEQFEDAEVDETYLDNIEVLRVYD